MSTDQAAPCVTLVLGGARSGKSRHAEALVRALTPPGGARIYVATAQALDAEMRARIAAHRDQRGPDWITLDAPLDLVEAVRREARAGRALLVDCLTLWLSNLLHAGRDIPVETEALATALERPICPIVLVSNEVGLGIVPENALARMFRDHQGRLNQRIAAIAARVVFIAAGLPITLKERA